MSMKAQRGLGPELVRKTPEREQMVVAPTISSLALLKVSYDRQHKDYFDNFVSMVAECLRRSAEDVVSLPDLQADLRKQFGLSLPQNAIRTVLKRRAGGDTSGWRVGFTIVMRTSSRA